MFVLEDFLLLFSRTTLPNFFSEMIIIVLYCKICMYTFFASTAKKVRYGGDNARMPNAYDNKTSKI